MELTDFLKTYGLEEKEAVVYVTCLQIGKETAFRIAQRCKLKRSTVYVKLNELQAKGLITISGTKKATLYEAASPRKLAQQLDYRRERLTEFMPLLLSLYKEKPSKPKIQMLEGMEGVEYVYREAMDYVKQGHELLAMSTLDQFQKEYASVFTLFMETMKNKKNKAREILNDGPFEREYIKGVLKNKNQNHQIKLAGKREIKNDNLIYANKIAIFSFEEELFVILIESKSISESYKHFFELMWQSAKSTS